MHTWRRHQTEAICALLDICAGNHRSPVNSPHKGQWRGALMFSLICVWIKGWVNNREAGDLRRHRAQYDVIVMTQFAVFCRGFDAFDFTYVLHIHSIGTAVNLRVTDQIQIQKRLFSKSIIRLTPTPRLLQWQWSNCEIYVLNLSHQCIITYNITLQLWRIIWYTNVVYLY